MRLTFFSLLFLPLLAWSQVTTCVSIENEVGDSLAGTYTFDIYLSTGAGSAGDLYLATSDVQIRFSAGNFTSPTLSALDNPSPPLGAIQNGYCTMIPTNTDNGGIVDWLSQATYHGALSTSLSGDLLSINLNTISVSSSNILTTIAKVDGTRSSHRLGKFRISGYTGNGAGLSIDTIGVLPTRIFTYAPSAPYAATATSIVACGALPLDWLSLEAKLLTGNHVALRWSTANEWNTDYFNIERKSLTGSYQVIGTVDAQGLGSASYSFPDQHPLQGRNIYRIRQIDTDGVYSLSNEVEILVTDGDFVIVSPNPTSNLIQVQIHASLRGHTDFRLLSLDGKLLLQKSWRANDPAPKEISLGGLAEGVYLYEIVASDRRFYGKVLKTD